ncbi:hypothetical protein EES39_39035 [Streptomyces sp. ADI92-24]|uniref:hypothetical protein n=1 Tax=unclassified Streptomyces TaxID=2593676 RepID=UPI000F55120A|nr:MULTISPECIES: hypothetical protein [unclassified Streptomyces]RPK32233.1 hypothetical protein EES39_39035 [Streptomyces sp. ADI92-24]WNI34405.1 hypothetical protein RLT59_37945 [Streptomyces sp. ITFR-6]
MADSLHTRYMAASDIWRTHRKGCKGCTAGRHCPAGTPLFEEFARLQTDYLAHLRAKKGTP